MDRIDLSSLPPLPSAEELFAPGPPPPLPYHDPISIFCKIPPPLPPVANSSSSIAQPVLSPQRPEVISPLSPASNTEFFHGLWQLESSHEILIGGAANGDCPVSDLVLDIKTSRGVVEDGDALVDPVSENLTLTGAVENRDTLIHPVPQHKTSSEVAEHDDAAIEPVAKRARYEVGSNNFNVILPLSPVNHVDDEHADDGLEDGEITDDSGDDLKLPSTPLKLTACSKTKVSIEPHGLEEVDTGRVRCVESVHSERNTPSSLSTSSRTNSSWRSKTSSATKSHRDHKSSSRSTPPRSKPTKSCQSSRSRRDSEDDVIIISDRSSSRLRHHSSDKSKSNREQRSSERRSSERRSSDRSRSNHDWRSSRHHSPRRDERLKHQSDRSSKSTRSNTSSDSAKPMNDRSLRNHQKSTSSDIAKLCSDGRSKVHSFENVLATKRPRDDSRDSQLCLKAERQGDSKPSIEPRIRSGSVPASASHPHSNLAIQCEVPDLLSACSTQAVTLPADVPDIYIVPMNANIEDSQSINLISSCETSPVKDILMPSDTPSNNTFVGSTVKPTDLLPDTSHSCVASMRKIDGSSIRHEISDGIALSGLNKNFISDAHIESGSANPMRTTASTLVLTCSEPQSKDSFVSAPVGSYAGKSVSILANSQNVDPMELVNGLCMTTITPHLKVCADGVTLNSNMKTCTSEANLTCIGGELGLRVEPCSTFMNGIDEMAIKCLPLTDVTCKNDFVTVEEIQVPDGDESKLDNSEIDHEFNIIDDIGSEVDELNDLEVSINSSDLESEQDEKKLNDLTEPEPIVTAEPIPPKTRLFRQRPERKVVRPKLKTEDGEEFEGPSEQTKRILVEKGLNPFDILPEGWLCVSHLCGMPVYLHKQLRVCTLSRPYFIGPGSVRKHNIPVSAIPCLQYRRAVEAEKKMETEALEGVPESTIPMEANQESGIEPNMEQSSLVMSNSVAEPATNPMSETPVTVNGPDHVAKCLDLAGADDAVRKSITNVKVQTVEDHEQKNCLRSDELIEYCKNLFQFKTITVRRFRHWKDRRTHNTMLKKAVRPILLPSTKLITCSVPAVKDDQNSKRKKEFVLNPAGKSIICVLHEYAQHTLHIQPRYIFKELENAETPYSATVVINDIMYGTGYASSKKNAKLEAARNTLGILIPDMSKELKLDSNLDLNDLSFFDDIKISDPRVSDLCIKAGQPIPFQVLCECLKRNFGMGDTQVQMEVKIVKHQRSEFIMRVGKHEAKVTCKNKREGKQLAAQSILQLLHPQLSTWGSILRLYSKSSEIKEKKQEEHSVTELQTKAEPNKAILSKLRQEMAKLYSVGDAMKLTVKGKLTCQGPNVLSTELGGVNL